MNEQDARTSLREFVARVAEQNGRTYRVEAADETFILRRVPAKHWAICSWPLGSVSGLFLHGLGQDSQSMGCYYEIFTTLTELNLLVAAPNLNSFNAALANVEQANETYRTARSNQTFSFTLWVKGNNREPFLLSGYRLDDVEEDPSGA